MNSASELTLGVAIPAYCNIQLLQEGLRSIQQVTPHLAESIYIVDDSGDGRVAAALRAHFPKIHWTIHEANCGFGRSANDAVAACLADIVILLNDDVRLKTDPSSTLRNTFQDPKLFAVTFQSQHSDDSFREGAKRLVWPFGLPRILHNSRDQLKLKDGRLPSAYAVGGHAAFHRKRFLQLGGFDPLFEPFYWEDVDLCQRARQNGWHTIYRPDCLVIHDGTGAIRSSHDAQYIREMTLRNRLLFARRHLPKSLRIPHEIAIFYNTLWSMVTDGTFARARLAAREREAALVEKLDRLTDSL